MALTQADRTNVTAKLLELLDQSTDTNPRDEIERINLAIRTQFPGREFCLAAEFRPDGSYDVFLEGVKAGARRKR
jgi:hypothetical protein